MTSVSPINDPEVAAPLEDGIGLCLSGGGYRAMLYHVGTLWRLYEAGILQTTQRISSVSGGSITAGVLALAWKNLSFEPARTGDDFAKLVAAPIMGLADHTLDADAIVGGIFLPGSIGDHIAAAYAKYLFGQATLQSLPDGPRFVINATNVQSGALWRFSKPYMGDWRVGRILSPEFPLARAVAASSAFPPVLSPVTVSLDPQSFQPGSGEDLQREPYTSAVVLADGGVYDNLGLETVWKRYSTVLVSDGGAKMSAEEEPKRDWARHAYRVLELVDNQVRSLRKRQLIASFEASKDALIYRSGAYWSIGSNPDNFGEALRFPCRRNSTSMLATTPTRLKRLDGTLQRRLVNWGYASCDAGLRAHLDLNLSKPTGLPFPTEQI